MGPRASVKILVYSDGPSVPTGFGTVVRNIFGPMIDGGLLASDDVSFFAVNYTGEPTAYPQFRQWPAKIGLSNDPDPYGRQRFAQMALANTWPFDILFVVQDHFTVAPFLPGLVQELRKQVAQGRPPFRVVQYIPVDGLTLKPEWVAWIPELVDYPVAYMHWSAAALIDMVPALAPTLRVIYHGSNPETFYPVPPETRREFRRCVMQVQDDQPLILWVNRNQPRKDPARALQIFAHVYRQHPQAVFYMHCNMQDGMGFNLESLRQQLRLPAGVVRFPANFSEGVGVTLEQLNLIYNAGDVGLTTARGEGFGLCVDPETRIQVPHGVKRMADIAVGDTVLAGDGIFHRVSGKVTRRAATLQIVPTGSPAIVCTPEHPFLSVPRQPPPSSAYYRQHNPEAMHHWVRADTLNKGDFVAIPRPRWTDPLPAMLDIAEFAASVVNDMEVDDTHCWLHMGYSPNSALSLSAISREYGVSKRVAEDARRYVLGRPRGRSVRIGTMAAKLASRLYHRGFVANRPNRCRRYIQVDDGLLEFLGWYLAEGSTGSGTKVEIDLHAKEMPIARRLAKFIEDRLELPTVVEQNGPNKCRMRVCSRIFVAFVRALCGHGAHHKALHPLLWRSATALGPLIGAYFCGDGHRSRNGWVLSTASEALAYQVRAIGAAAGVFMAIRPLDRNQHGYTLTVGGDAQQRFSRWVGQPDHSRRRDAQRRHAVRGLVTDNFIYVPVRSIRSGTTQQVMDIAVEGSHDFVGNGVLLHNTNLEMQCVGLPIIAPKHTAFAELYSEDRGLLVPPLPEQEIIIMDNDQLRPVADIAAMAKKVCWAIEHPEHARGIGRRGMQWAQSISWRGSIVPQWTALLREAMESLRPAPVEAQPLTGGRLPYALSPEALA